MSEQLFRCVCGGTEYEVSKVMEIPRNAAHELDVKKAIERGRSGCLNFHPSSDQFGHVFYRVRCAGCGTPIGETP